MTNLCYSYKSLYKDEIFEKLKKKHYSVRYLSSEFNFYSGTMLSQKTFVEQHSILMIFSSMKFPLRHFYVTLYTSTIAYPIMNTFSS